MKKTPAAKAKRARAAPRTNVERTAEMRAKLIQAATDILFEKGYAAATTVEVTKRAKASRGAMLHHFPTRVDLLLATAQHIIHEQRQYRRDRLASVEDNWNRFVAAADVTWEVHRQPATVALLEIMLASRSDRELHKRFSPHLKEMAALRAESAERLANTLGIRDVKALDDLIFIHNASLRGLTINLMFAQEHEAVEQARKLLTTYEHTFAKRLIDDAAKRAKR